MRAIATALLLSLPLLSAIPGVAVAEEQWQLVSRHGGCFPVKSLARKFPDLGNISDPDEFVTFVRAKGLEVSSQPIQFQGGKAVEVLVPSKELSLVFVRAEACSKANKFKRQAFA